MAILGRDNFDHVGLYYAQKPWPKSLGKEQPHLSVNTISDQTFSTDQIAIAEKFPDLVTRVGKSKHHVVKTTFHKNLVAKQQKGRRIPINLQDRVEKELQKLTKEGHIVKLNSCSDEFFISPIVITVKKDDTIKLALDSKIINKSIHKNKYQMPNIENLMDSVGEHLACSKDKNAPAWFSSLDLKYAYSQLKLHPDTSKHCNFNIVGGKATGTYRFLTGFYGLTDMPAEFQKAIDNPLINLSNTFCFLDDILIASRGTKEEHMALVNACLKRINDENLAISLKKCKIAVNEIEWLGYKIDSSGYKPLESKVRSIIELPEPTTFRILKQFMGAVQHIKKHIKSLAKLCAPLRSLLSTTNSNGPTNIQMRSNC